MGKKNKPKNEKENKPQGSGQQPPAGAGRPAEGPSSSAAAAQQAPKPATSGAKRPTQTGGATGGQQPQSRGPPQQQGASPAQQQGKQQWRSTGESPGQQHQQQQRAPQQASKFGHQQQQHQPQGQQRQPQGSVQQQQQQPQGPGQQQQPGAWIQQGPGQKRQPQGPGQQQQHQRQPQGPGQQQQPGAWTQQGPGQQRQPQGPGQQQQHQRQPQGPGQQRQPQGPGQQQQPQGPGPQRQPQGPGQQQHPGAWTQQGPGQQRQQQGQGQQRQPHPSGSQQRMQQQQPQQQSQQEAKYQAEQQFQKLQIGDTASVSSTSSNTSIIKRGTQGQKGECETNYLRLDLSRMPDTAFHYDVTITPDRPKKFLRPAFNQFNRQFFPQILMAYDGIKSCYSAQRIENIENGFEQSVVLDDSGNRQITFKIAIKPTASLEIDLRSLRTYHTERVYDKPMRALQCLEVVLASSCHDRGIRGGRSFYNKPPQTIPLGIGYELYTGLYQAMTLGDEPFLNVDIAHKSFPREMPVLDFFQNNRDVRNFSPQQTLEPRARYALLDFLKGIKIVYHPPKNFGSFDKEYVVRDISEEPAHKKMFTLEDGRRLSVAEYFKEKGYILRFPNLNCLIVGSTVKTISLPIELCTVKGGQAIKKKDDANVVSDMIKQAATSTNVRKDKIMALLARFQHNSSLIVQDFGIRIGNAFITVPMRLLSPPNIEYFNKQIARVNNGSWRMDDNVQYLVTKPKQHKWAVIYSKDSRSMNYNTLTGQRSLVANLLMAAKGHNLDLNPKPFVDSFDRIDSKLNDLKKENYDLVIVVIPFRRTTYADIKQAAELKVGILTQCIKENTVERRCDMMLANNLLLKINAKLNGTNHKIDTRTHVPLKNVMFLGADVTHPSPDQRAIPSVVGVAASHDPFGACYNLQYRLQKSTCENIEDMESIFTHHMQVYKRYNNTFPDQIIYYRDGVSDGQFKIVKRNELRAIRAACQKLKVKPKITCIIVVKRHHTRFFPTQPTRDRKFNNVDPGTVVDKIIVHPNEVQFFMVSHQSIQGTAKPTRYNVIEDDANMDIDELQRLTHNLCHLFPRCNRAVSYPTPVYLAHLVAFRGRVYLEGTRQFGDLNREYEKRQINANFMVSNPMYFV